MRPIQLIQNMSLGILLCVVQSFASAADTTTDLSTPPKLEQLEGSNEPTITIKPESKSKITETRSQGKVTDIKVKSGKSTYHIRPNTPSGSTLPGDLQGNSVRGAQWEIMEFDVGQRKQKEAKKVDSASPAAAEPPATPANSAK
ncbi:MAG: DUF2782 domain-containing protein [Pseudomonadota bacterium]